MRGILEQARLAAHAYFDRPGIVPLHGITAPAAFLLIAGHLPEAVHQLAAEAFGRTHAQLFREPGPRAQVPDQAPADVDVTRVTGAHNAHPIKLVEASLRLAVLTENPTFVACARTMTAWVPPRRAVKDSYCRGTVRNCASTFASARLSWRCSLRLSGLRQTSRTIRT